MITNQSAIDATMIDEYKSIADAGFVHALIEQYLAESAVSIAAIDAAFRSGRSQALAAEAHHLRGSSTAIGARTVAAMCGEIEALARLGALDRASSLCATLPAEHARAGEELRALS